MTATATMHIIPTTAVPSAPAPARRPAENRQTPTGCEHAWTLDSRHTTSAGIVRYESCVRCAAHRVDLLAVGALAPEPISRIVRGR